MLKCIGGGIKVFFRNFLISTIPNVGLPTKSISNFCSALPIREGFIWFSSTKVLTIPLWTSPDFSLIYDPIVQIHGGQVRVGHEEHREAAGAGRETSSLGSRLLQADIARLSSHWTSFCITEASLVERFRVMPYHKDTAQVSQSSDCVFMVCKKSLLLSVSLWYGKNLYAIMPGYISVSDTGYWPVASGTVLRWERGIAQSRDYHWDIKVNMQGLSPDFWTPLAHIFRPNATVCRVSQCWSQPWSINLRVVVLQRPETGIKTLW